MRPSPPARSRTLALTGFAMILMALFVIPVLPAGALPATTPSPHSVASPVSASPSFVPLSTPRLQAAGAWQNTSITTTDRLAGRNVALNWSLRTNYPTLTGALDFSSGAKGDNLTILGGEEVGRFMARVGFNAYYTGTTTVLHPAIDLNGSIYTDPSVSLPNPGIIAFRMVRVGGDWWTFSANSNLIVANGQTNGTYNLTAPSSSGFAAHPWDSPSLNVSEWGPSLPINNNAFYAAATPALEVNTSRAPTTGYIPDIGVYLSDLATPADSVPMIGENQVPTGLGYSFAAAEVAVNPSAFVSGVVPPTTTNGTILWGANPTAPGTTDAWLGAYTVDPTYSNVTGARLVTVIPSATTLPPEGQTIANQLIVPVNGTWDIVLEMVDANISFTFNGTTYSEVGTFPIVTIYNQTATFGTWAGQAAQTPGALETLSVQRSSTPWWWTITLDGTPVTGWIDQNDAAFNGTFQLNASTMWGETNQPYWALPSGQAFLAGVSVPFLSTDQPMLAFFGNHTNYWINSSLLLQNSGGWGTPLRGYAWSYCAGSAKACPGSPPHQDDVLLGSDQHGYILPGTVLVANTTAFGLGAPLLNGTLIWTATLIRVVASPYTIASGASVSVGGTTSLVIYVTYGGVPEAKESLSACTDLLGLGQCGVFNANPNFPGVYYDNFTASKVVTTLQVDSIEVLMFSTNGLAASGAVGVNITTPVLLAGAISGHGQSGTFTPGESLTIEAWTNQSNLPLSTGVGVEEAFLPTADGPECSMTLVSPGFFDCTITLYATLPCTSSSCTTSISLSTTGAGLNDATVTISPVTIETYPMTISPITVSVSKGTQGDVAPGAFVNFSVTVMSGSTPLTGATVTFTFTPTLGGGQATLSTAVSTSGGVYTVGFRAPTDLTSTQWYNVTATAVEEDYSSATAGKVAFELWPPAAQASPVTNNNSLLDSPLFLGAILVVVLVAVMAIVLVLRKRMGGKGGEESSAPAAWTGPAQPGTAPQPGPGGPTDMGPQP